MSGRDLRAKLRARPRRMTRVLLCTEGTYPFSMGGVSTWCHHLIEGLAPAGYQFTIHALHAGAKDDVLALPGNVIALRAVRPGRPPGTTGAPAPNGDPSFEAALADVLLGCAGQPGRFAAGLQALAALGEGAALWPRFARRRVPQVLVAGLRQLGPFPITAQDVQLGARWLRDLLVPALCLPAPAQLAVATAAGPGALPAWLARTRRGVPFVLVDHGVALREALLALNAEGALPAFKALQAAFREALARLLYRAADAVIAVCRFNTTWEYQLGAAPERSRVIHNGIDPAAYPARTAGACAAPTVGWTGRIDPLKGLETLIQAFAQVVTAVPRARLRIAGPTPRGHEAYHHALCRQVRALGLEGHVTFEGPTDRVQPVLCTSDVIALPSVSEGLPYVLLEAMMTGCAVVAHRVGGVPEALGDAGRLVAPHDPEAFAQALTALLRNPAQRAALGTRARERGLRHFTVQPMLRAYHQTFTDVLASAPR